MKASQGAIPVFRIALLLMIVVDLTYGDPSSIDSNDIKEQLDKYFHQLEKETGIPESKEEQEKIKTMYTDGTKSTKEPSLTLKEVAQVVISLEEEYAVEHYDQKCESASQDLVDKAYDEAAKDHSFKKYLEAFKKLDAHKTKFCDIFALLRCQRVQEGTVDEHRCRCPADMIREDNHCVLTEGRNCLKPGHWRDQNKIFPIYDFKEQDFIKHKQFRCEKKTVCNVNPENSFSACEVNYGSEYLASPFELAEFLKKLLEKDKVDEKEIHEILRHELKDITKQERKSFRLALSLEMHMQTKLLDYDAPCEYDKEREKELAQLLSSYNSDAIADSPWNADGPNIGQDITRINFHKKVIKDNKPVCNRFKQLQCTSSNKCECKDRLAATPSSSGGKICVTQHSYKCGNQAIKLFELTRIAGTGGVELKYYKRESASCSSGSTCTNVPYFGDYCMHTSDLADLTAVHLEFEKKFSLEIDGACSETDQKALLQKADDLGPITEHTFVDAKKAIEELTTTPSQYCRIRKYAMCQKNKCVCIPPTKPRMSSGSPTTCAAPYHWKCDAVIKSKIHEQFDKLQVPVTQKVYLETASKLFCTADSECIKPSFLDDSYCRCPNKDKYGELCDKSSSNHLAHLSVLYLPPDMRNVDGIRIISEFHDPLTKIDSSMTLKHGATCDSVKSQELANIMEFLADIREACDCVWTEDPADKTKGSWSCSELCKDKTDSKFQKPNFESVLKEAKALASKSPTLCNWNHAERCVKGTCACADNFYIEKDNCRVDLGGHCYKWTADHDHTATCRSGLQCARILGELDSKSYCEHMDYKSKWGPCKKPEDLEGDCKSKTIQDYILYVKGELENQLKNGSRELFDESETQGDLHSCNIADEMTFSDTQREFEQVLGKIKESTEKITDPQDILQHVRLMHTVVTKLKELKDVKVCVRIPGISCNKDTKKCELKHQKYTDFKTYSTAPALFQQISNALLLTFIGFILAQNLQ